MHSKADGDSLNHSKQIVRAKNSLKDRRRT